MILPLLALCDHRLDTGLGHQEIPRQVHIKCIIPCVERIILECARRDPLRSRVRVKLRVECRAVDKDVKAIESLQGRVDDHRGSIQRSSHPVDTA